MRTHIQTVVATRASVGLLVLATMSAATASAASVGHNNYNHHSHTHNHNLGHGHNRQQIAGSGARISFQLQQQQSQHLQQDTLILNATESAPLDQELHFGAKVALSILAAAILLVVGATYADYETEAKQVKAAYSISEQFVANDSRDQQMTIRDQRSPSLSSHNSSTLFCSANSVASASVPILGHGHFKRNLRLSLTKPKCNTDSVSSPTTTTPTPTAATTTTSDIEQQQHEACTSPPVWRIERDSDIAHNSDTMESINHINGLRNNLLSWQFARQLFLSFSLRNSASLIFHRQEDRPQSIDSLHGLRFLSMIWLIAMHSYSFAFRWMFFAKSPSLDDIYKTAASQLLANGTFACDSFLFAGGFLLPYLTFPATASNKSHKQQTYQSTCSSPDLDHTDRRQEQPAQEQKARQVQAKALRSKPTKQSTNEKKWRYQLNTNEFTFARVLGNLLHRYIRMMPLMMAIIGLSATLLRYLGEGPAWEDSTLMFDKWCRKNWWINALFMHNFINRENMCLSHSWYSAVDIQLFLVGQLILFVLFRSKKLGLLLLAVFLFGAQLITGALTLIHHLPAVPQLASFSEQTMNRYYGEIYIKPYCRASPYLIGILLAYFMRTTSLGSVKLNKWQVVVGWTASISLLLSIIMAMQPAMNGRAPSELESALYSALSRPLWACATGWMIFACMTNNGGLFASILSARFFIPLSKLTYPAFLIHPIVMAVFYGSRQSSFEFSHYLMLYLILGNIVITYASALVLSALFELPLLSSERAIKRALR